MWDQKSAQKHSDISDGDKKIFESSSGLDSGFHSGPQDLSTDIDIQEKSFEHQHYTTSTSSVQQPKQNPNDTDKLKEKSEITDTFIDSGLCDSTEQSEPMILDVDLNLNEWFCGLNIQNATNNLDCESKKKSSASSTIDTTAAKCKKPQIQTPLWKICYMQDEDGDTQLHLAIIGEYLDAICAIIRLAPFSALLDIRNDDSQAPIHLAVLTKQPNIVRKLLVAGAKATVRDRNGNTPLHLACLNSDMDCVKALTLPITTEEVEDLFKYRERKPQIFQKLPVDLEQKNYDGEQCVHITTQKNDIEILDRLIELGADINAREGKSGYTPLHMACENGKSNLIEFLLKCPKLNTEAYTYGRWTAYQLAAGLKHTETMSALKLANAIELSPPVSDDDSDYSDYSDSGDDLF